jgi:D-arabinose 1-dehydrogenase-like Zn-dependent alcohol dehydrogenase
VQVMPALLPLKALTITGSYVGSLQDMHELMALARQGRLPPLPVDTRPLAQVSQVLDELRGGRIRGRTVLIA